MASGVYNIFKQKIMEKLIDLVNDTIKVALMNNSHSFAASSVTNDEWSDVSANEASGTGYTTGGASLASKAVTVDNTDNEGVFDAADVTWSSSTITAYHAVIYDDTTATKYLIASIDFSGAKSSSAGNFTIQWNAEGILNIT